MKISYFALLLTTSLALVGCCPNSTMFEPCVPGYTLPDRAAKCLDAPFPTLTQKEKATEWGKQMYLGKAFARDMDLYRALTCFKSARFLIQKSNRERLEEIDYDIFLAYYMGNKYDDAIDAFETSSLMSASLDTFPALHEMYVALYDAYMQTGHYEKAASLLQYIDCKEPETGQYLRIEEAVQEGDINGMIEASAGTPLEENTNFFLQEYLCEVKSPRTAQTLNAVLPGAGYLYVGQKKTALTSLIVNALFIAASYELFQHGYIAAGIITASLEAGWYFGGINGAGLAAKQLNENRYECLARDYLIDNKILPVLMITMGF